MSVWTLSKIAHNSQRSRKIVGNSLDITVTEPEALQFQPVVHFRTGWHFVFDLATVGNLLRAVPAQDFMPGFTSKSIAMEMVPSRFSRACQYNDRHMIHASNFSPRREDANAKAVHAAVDEPYVPSIIKPPWLGSLMAMQPSK